LEITLPTEPRFLSFHDRISDVREAWKADETDYYASRGKAFSEYLSYHNLGIELLFENEALVSVFIYIFQKSEKFEPFQGSCSYLDVKFWKKPSLDAFIKSMEDEQFTEIKTGSSQTTKFVKDNTSCVFSESKRAINVAFDLHCE